jgi:hypothetical protein
MALISVEAAFYYNDFHLMSADVEYDALRGSLSAVTDRLLERVAALTRTMQTISAPLDDTGRATARLMLDDLRLVAESWRGLQGEIAQQLHAATSELTDANAILKRVVDAPNA